MNNTQIEELYLDKCKKFEETLSPEQKNMFYELEFLREKLEENINIKTPV
jgi:hypothetical protein